MNGAFYIGATGLEAQERALAIIANNVTNMNTSGFKRSGVRFTELMATAPDVVSQAQPAHGGSAMTVAGVALDDSAEPFSPGEIKRTSNPLDLAIDGEGYIEVVGASGEPMLWRGGTLRIGEDGVLGTTQGLPLKAMISVPEGATDLAISREGIVSARLAGADSAQEIGRIDLVTVSDPGAISADRDGLYRVTDEGGSREIGADSGSSRGLVQGAIESSNVQISDEMVQMLVLQRAFGASAQVVQAGDQLMAMANNLRR